MERKKKEIPVEVKRQTLRAEKESAAKTPLPLRT